MANVWVGTDYYIPSVDQSGDSFIVQINSTTTSNTYVYETVKNSATANSETVGAASIVYLKDFGWPMEFQFDEHEDDSRRVTLTPSSTTSTEGEGLVVEYAIAANGFIQLSDGPYPNNFDRSGSNNHPYHVTNGGSGWEEQDELTFTNISGGYPKGRASSSFVDPLTTESIVTFKGYIVWTDKNGPCFMDGTPEVDLASNATYHVNVAIRAGSWTP